MKTAVMPARLAYWTTLRFIRARVWDEQALLELLVGDLLYSLPEPKAGELNLIFDTTSLNTCVWNTRSIVLWVATITSK